MGRKIPRCHPNCRHAWQADRFAGALTGAARPAHHRMLGKWTRCPCRRFTPATGSLYGTKEQRWLSSYAFRFQISRLHYTMPYPPAQAKTRPIPFPVSPSILSSFPFCIQEDRTPLSIRVFFARTLASAERIRLRRVPRCACIAPDRPPC